MTGRKRMRQKSAMRERCSRADGPSLIGVVIVFVYERGKREIGRAHV